MDNKLKSAFHEAGRDLIPQNIHTTLTVGFPMHFHHQMEILCVTQGSFSVSVNNQTQTVTQGMITVADSFDAHSYTMLDENSIGIVLIVKKDYLLDYKELTRNLTLTDNFLCNNELFEQSRPLFERLLELEQSISKTKDNTLSQTAFDHYRKALAGAILALIAAHGDFQEKGKSNDALKIRDILKYIYENSHRNITLESLSKHFGYTSTHFSHLFNKSTGFRLKDYLNRTRTYNAAALMRNGVTLTQAAFDAGFESLSSFYRVFKQVYEVSPKQYIQQQLS